MIVGTAGGRPRPRYAAGIVVALLMVAGFAVVEGKPTNPASTPTATARSLVPPSALSRAEPTVAGPPFVARFVCPAAGATGVPVRCVDQATPPAGTVTYQWSVGPDVPNQTAVSTSASFNYAFPVAGQYLIELRVEAEGQDIATTFFDIAIH